MVLLELVFFHTIVTLNYINFKSQMTFTYIHKYILLNRCRNKPVKKKGIHKLQFSILFLIINISYLFKFISYILFAIHKVSIALR